MNKNILDKKFNPKVVEDNKYDFWLTHDLFSPSKEGEPFSIILPPPNVTGHLHLGHAWDVSLQDAIIRYKKLQGYSTIWIPGTDHAGIATQTKFEKILKETQNKSRFDLGRDNFLKQLFDWKEHQADFIKKQWKKMGLALSYENEIFTMDPEINRAVNLVFVTLYNEGLIYREKKLVNWDPILKTAISNIEVVHELTKSKMYYFDYYSKDKKYKVTVATTRPETMFGDVCLFAHPDDIRYKDLKDISFINPANDKEIPLYFDSYIDKEFGTGVMKCTPAHDFNDYELAKKHKLPLINILNDDATLNDQVDVKYQGLDVLKARDLLVDEINKKGLLNHIDEIENNIGYSERTKAIVQPYLSYQWFLKMKPLAQKIIDTQKNDTQKTHFIPPRFNDTLLNWLNNIEDWCISRQLWWGHQIPIWYKKNTNEVYCGLQPPKNSQDYIRDEDVLDTWFSSALWPLVCYKWPNENNPLFKKYFPCNVLVTGYDIIFFWVSRMMIQTEHFVNQLAFKEVIIHGLIRDEQGRKMSKSLGNGIDPMDVIDQYGCDALRLFLTSTASQGEDLNYSNEKLAANWNFLNKLWNGARFIFNLTSENTLTTSINKADYQFLDDIDLFILNKFNHILNEVTKNMDKYNFVVSTNILINFIWNDFLNTYLEFVKFDLQNNSKNKQLKLQILLFILKQVCIMLHAQCPFITEEIYQFFDDKKLSIMLEKWPKKIDVYQSQTTIYMIEVLETVRKLRLEKQIKKNVVLKLSLKTLQPNLMHNLDFSLIKKYLKMENGEIIDLNSNQSNDALTLTTKSFAISFYLENILDQDAELKRLTAKKEELLNEIKRSETILNNQNFLNKAPEQKVILEKNKYSNYLEQLKSIEYEIEKLAHGNH